MRAYVGRFAPSPSGPLHFGSLVAAMASYLDAKAHNGKWLLRMEDLDTRTREGAADGILRDLERLGLEWDDAVVYQSQRPELYKSAFARLKSAGLIYPCACSRKDSAGRYAGSCAAGLQMGQAARSWRLRVAEASQFQFLDRVHGYYVQNVQTTVGDFIVRRADGPFAYQLAVVVDDDARGVTDVVRGADLLDNAPRQMYLQQCLGLAGLRYAHVPLATDKQGQKLSKSKGAAALSMSDPGQDIVRALKFLGHELPRELCREPVRNLLQWGRGVWRMADVPKQVND